MKALAREIAAHWSVIRELFATVPGSISEPPPFRYISEELS